MNIEWIDYKLPNKIIYNSQLNEAFPTWNVALAEERTGVQYRHWFRGDEQAVNLVNEIIGEHNDIPDAIIYCTQTPTKHIPGDAFLLHKLLNLPKDVVVFDYSAACSGFIGGLKLARGLLVSREVESVMLVTAEVYSAKMGWGDSQRESCLLFGDGVAVTYLKQNWREEPRSIGKIILYTDGSGYDLFCESENGLYMDGKAILEFVMRAVSPLVEEIVANDNSTMDDIDLFVFHQASKVSLDYLFRKLKIPKDKQFTNLENIGNTVSASIPIALKDAEMQGRLHSGMKVLIAGFGSGLSWGGTIIEW